MGAVAEPTLGLRDAWIPDIDIKLPTVASLTRFAPEKDAGRYSQIDGAAAQAP